MSRTGPPRLFPGLPPMQRRLALIGTTAIAVGVLARIALPLLLAGEGTRPAPCRLSQFAVWLGPGISEATGQHTLALRLVNHGRTCVLNGYPQLTLTDASGTIPFVISHQGDQMISSRPPSAVLAHRGDDLFVVMNQYRCDTQTLRVTTKIQIGIPGAGLSATASIAFPSLRKVPLPYRIPAYCGKGDPGSKLAVSPFVPTMRAAMAH
jgi:hypothetical protein